MHGAGVQISYSLPLNLIFLCYILKGEGIKNLPMDMLCFMQEEKDVLERPIVQNSRSKTLVSEFKMLMDIHFARG